MGLRDRLSALFGIGLAPTTEETRIARRDVADTLATLNRENVRAAEAGITLPWGAGMDSDDGLYRRLTTDAKQARRDLTPMAQDRMLEVAYFLWEQNAFAKRLVTLMTDLILGEGVTVVADDAKNQEVIDRTWNHRENKLTENIRGFYNSLSVNGELALTVGPNPINGITRIGFIDPYQVKDIVPVVDNVLVPDIMVLKGTPGQEGQRLRIIREDAETGRLDGEVFFFRINSLPNGMRGRSDLGPIADWLDLYDQFMYGELERANLLSHFVWDWKVDGADDKRIQEKLKTFPKLKSGQVFAHNEKETLEPISPDLKAQDRSEIAQILRVHIAGAMGYPTSYLGDTTSNRATIEGQNDVMMKTPAARQKEFVAILSTIVRFAIEQSQSRNPSLFRDVKQGYRINVPEISAKDISRVGQVASTLVSAMDTAMSNQTMSRKGAVEVTCAVLKQLGIELKPETVIADADEEAKLRQEKADEIHAGAANRNSPIPDDPEVEDEEETAGATA